MRRMAMGMNRAILCCRSVARESRAAGRWKTREETAAHRKTPYHISGQTHRHSVTHQSILKHSLYSSTMNWSNELMTTNFNCLFLYMSWIYPVFCMLIFLVATSSQLHLFFFTDFTLFLVACLSIYQCIKKTSTITVILTDGSLSLSCRFYPGTTCFLNQTLSVSSSWGHIRDRLYYCVLHVKNQ